MGLIITTPVTTVADTSNVTSYTTAAFTPTADSLLVIFAAAEASIATGTFSDTSGLTWNLLNRAQGGGDTWWMWWAQVGSSPISITENLDLTGDAATGAFIKTYQVTGHDPITPIAQFVNTSAKTTGANPVLTLPGNMNTNNAYIATLFNTANPFGATAPTGWTLQTNTGFATPASGIASIYRVNGETGNTITFTAASSTWFGGAVEINVAPSVGFSKMLTLLGVG